MARFAPSGMAPLQVTLCGLLAAACPGETTTDGGYVDHGALKEQAIAADRARAEAATPDRTVAPPDGKPAVPDQVIVTIPDSQPGMPDQALPVADAPPGCKAVPTPAKAPDPWTVRAPGVGFGGIVKQTGKYTDAMDQGITNWQGWRGDGKKSPYFHNVRAHISFGLGAGKTVRGISYMALGNFSTVKSELQSVLNKRPPFGSLDTPASLVTTVSAGKALPLSGWVLDTAAIKTVKVSIDGKVVATLPVGKKRDDVCAVYPAYSGCPAVGFSGTLSTAGLGPCPRLLAVAAADAHGNVTVLGQRKLVLK